MLPVVLLLTVAVVPPPISWGVSPVPDRELATMRGGILLPNGLNIAIGIDIQTRINGVLALHTVYSSEAPAKGVQVYTDGRDSPSTATGSTVVTTGGTQNASVDASRSPAGTTVIPATSSQPTTINVVSGPTSTWLNGAGQNNVAVVANGPAISAPSGTISLTEDAEGARVTLSTPTTEIQHLVGQATGSVVSNTANDRTIDTVSSINVNLVGVPAGLLGSALMINRIAVDAVSRR